MGEPKKEPKKKDIWDILSSVGGIATAVMVAVIGLVGSYVLNNQQTLANRSQLYSQLISQKETAENQVRRDMFQQILTCFLANKNNSRCVVEEIDDQLLRLELLARNFHEMLDMEPLFLHVLKKIVREIPKLEQPALEKVKSQEAYFEEIKYMHSLWIREGNDTSGEKFIENLKKKRLKRLIKIAKRIVKKQVESLNGVLKKKTFIVNLTNKTCEVCPADDLDENIVYCGNKEFFQESFELALNNGSKRKFEVIIKYSYPKWKQVKVCVRSYKTYLEKKADGSSSDYKEETFWLTHFDFPLSENTFLSDKERYAVILNKIDGNEAKISFLYFPASYAGLKEKSFYQQQLMSHLLEKKFLR